MSHRRVDPHTAARLKRLARCPDCASTVTVHRTGPVLYEATVAHDRTCPWHRAQHGGRGFSRITLLPASWQP